MSLRKFELAGSKPHYPPSKEFTIKHLKLEIKPDFESERIEAIETLEIQVIKDNIQHITLDASELNIRSVKSNGKDLEYKVLDDSLRIEFEAVAEGTSMSIEIKYDARPRRGFFFIKPDQYYQKKRIQAWTQGEATESRFWFPCVDHPYIKFTSEMIIEVPKNFVAISNGKLINIEESDENRKYHWLEEHPHSAYLTSLVIGEFAERKDNYNGIDLLYYYPKDMESTAMLSFNNTKDMLAFFEEYTGVKYPYEKYAQVTVDDFIYGGMENINATTLTSDTLHDEKAHIDFTSDHLVSHELAHQWFGDLVTCRDWQHLWLNESFATYFEALYWEKSRGSDEFEYYMMQIAEEYFEEASTRYKRPIVTNLYKYSDELFDRHTYEKGACVLHMLRRMLGDRIFRRAVKLYLERFQYTNAETDDFRRCAEEASGASLQQFFDQWLRRAGHPELRIEFSFDHISKIASIKITQTQLEQASEQTQAKAQEPFVLPLDVKIVTNEGSRIYTFNIDSKEHVFNIPLVSEPRWFSIDPENKVLKRLDLKAPKQMLITQLKEGNVIERIYAAKALSNFSSDDVVDALKQVMKDSFWGTTAECARALSNMKTDYAYKALVDLLNIEHPKARRAIVKALGEFKKAESVQYLVPFLTNDESYFVQAEAALALGKTKSKDAIPHLLRALQIRSFNEVIASSIMTGLGEMRDDIAAHILVDRSKVGEHHKVREAATLALGKYVKDNASIFEHLAQLLRDRWFKVRINAIKAFVEAQESKAIPELEWVAKNDLDNRVRRAAEEGIISIREAIQMPKEISQMREEIERLKTMNMELVQRLDRMERENV